MELKNKRRLVGATCCAATLALGVAVLATNVLSLENKDNGVAAVTGDDYSLTIDGSLGLADKASAIATTTSCGKVTFEASGLVSSGKQASSLGTLDKNGGDGYFKNSTAITGLKSVLVNFADLDLGTGVKVSLGIMNGQTLEYVASKILDQSGTITVSDLTTYDVSYAKIEVDNSNGGLISSEIASVTYAYSCTKTTTEYQKISYSVEGSVAKTEYVVNGSAFSSSYIPTLDGYTFKSWVDADGNGITGNVTAATTAYASWYRNVEEGVAGSVRKDLYTFEKAYQVINATTMSTGAKLDDYSAAGFLIGATVANTEYSVTLPNVNYSKAVAAGGEVSFNLYTIQEWEYFNVAGGDIYYQDGHGQTDPYRISIRNNGVGLGVYATSSSYSNFGEIAILSDEVANGTSGLVIKFHSEQPNRQVYVSKLSIYTLDYKDVIASALSNFTTTSSKANYLSYQAAVAENLTTYEKTQYSEPAAITTAKSTYASQTNAMLTFPTQAAYFADTNVMRKTSGDIGVNSDGLNAIGDGFDTGAYGWEFQFSAGKTSAFIEFPKFAYSNYSTVLFKMWRGGENGSLSANGTKLIDTTDCPNQEWAYWVEITTSGSSSTLNLYHGAGGYTKGDATGTAWTLTADVAAGKTPFHLTVTPSAAFTTTAVWGITSFVGTI